MKRYKHKRLWAALMAALFIFNVLSGFPVVLWGSLPSVVHAQTAQEKSAIILIGDSRVANLYNHLGGASSDKFSGSYVKNGEGYAWFTSNNQDYILAFKGGAANFSEVKGYASNAIETMSDADSVGAANAKSNFAAYNLMGLGGVTADATSRKANANKMADEFKNWANGVDNIKTSVQCSVMKTGGGESRTNDMVEDYNTALFNACNANGLNKLDLYSKVGSKFDASDSTHQIAASDKALVNVINADATRTQNYVSKVQDDTDDSSAGSGNQGSNTGGSSTSTPSFSMNLTTVEELLEYSNHLQEANNTLTGYIHNSVDGTNTYLASIDNSIKQTNIILNDIKGLMGTKGQAALTEVYSVNNEIANCYYKPNLDEIYMLEQFVLSQGFASAYTGFFDLDSTAPYTANEESRALEILGYDFLLSDESYNGSTYTASRVQGGISRQTAIMDVYKALGIEMQEIQLYFQPTTKEELINSPAIKDLSWIVNDVDSSRGKTSAFITRTNPTLYVNKAKTDLHLSDSAVSSTSTITLGDFIVLVAAMMDFYGEPVISDAEMNTLLQVFGSNIPQALTGNQRNAYIYLRSRGILTDEYMSYETALTFDQMTTILMRVKDTDSRQNLKEIQVTMNISDTLKSAGYFPKTISLTSDANAVQVKKSYYYDDVTYYDYLVDRASTGFFGDNVFIPVDVQNYATSQGLNGASYVGVETHNGKQYYHFRIYAAAENTTYFAQTQQYANATQIFLIAEAKSDHFVAVKQGGGIYTVGNAKSGVYDTSRQSFGNSFDGYVDAERKGVEIASDQSIIDTLLAKISNIFEPAVAKAATPVPSMDDYDGGNTTQVKVKLTVYNASKVSGFANTGSVANTYASWWDQAEQDLVNDTRTLVIDEAYVNSFLANIVRSEEEKVSNPAITSIASVAGDNVLVNLDYLVDMGLVYKPVSGVWDLDPEVPLTLDTKYGRVVLNQTCNLVVTGTTLYKVPAGQVLFTVSSVDANKDGHNDVLVDFRAAYGWSRNDINMTIVGTGDSTNVNISPIADAAGTSIFKAVKEYKIQLPIPFNNEESAQNIGLFLQGGLVSSHEEMLMLSNYPLSNWMVYSSENDNFLYVFYHKDAFTSYGLTPPSDMDDLKKVCYPYNSIDGDNWVVRKFVLNYNTNGTPGQMTYTVDYGFLYNVPTADEFSMEKYLNGEIMLPIYTTSTNATGARRNANVNIWSGCKYGTRPVKTEYDAASKSTVMQVVDINGTVETITGPTKSVYAMKATPAGVQALFGGSTIKNVAQGSDFYSLVQDAKSNSLLACYYGTNKINIDILSSGKSSAYISLNAGTDLNWLHSIDLSERNVFYEMARWKISKDSSDVCRRYICFDDVMELASVDDAGGEEAIEASRTPIIIEDGGYDETYGDFDQFSFQYLLDKIDAGTSWVLVITVKIIPMIMIIALTIIVGLSLMSDNKIIQKIVAKTIDPVKILTFGRRSFDQLTKKNSIVILMLGYAVFILIADGNILRVIVMLSKMMAYIARGLRMM